MASSGADDIQRSVSFTEMEKALESLSNHRLWLLCIFLMCSCPGMFNAWHILVSAFYAFTPPHWCQIPELSNANWTMEQIKEVSMPKPISEDKSSCTMIGWNYTHLAFLGYEKALQFINTTSPPEEIPCESFAFDDEEPYASVVSEWSLVCDNKIYKTAVQSSIAIGKLIGGFMFGIIADRYGRKISFVLSCITYIISGPLAAFAPSLWFFIIIRFIIGVAGSGCYETGFTILAELVSTKWRTILGCAFNCSYPVGYIILAIGTLSFSSWRNLQFGISLPMLILLLCCWFVPESPRWLVTQGRNEKAWKIINKVDKTLVRAGSPADADHNNAERHQHTTSTEATEKRSTLWSLFTSCELMNRLFLGYFAWFTASLVYYVLALNSDNFGTDRHLYTLLCGIVEIPGYLLLLFILLFVGLKLATALLFFVTGIALVAISGLSKDETYLIMMLVLVGRFTGVCVFGAVMVYTSGLFPTTTRNFAVGSSLAVSQFGSIYAPYIVDFLSVYGWHVPSTICGVGSLLCTALVLLLPETKGKPLLQTVDELKLSKDRVSIYNCCKMS